MKIRELLNYINENHECKHLFWRKRRGQDIDDLFKLQKRYNNTNLYFNIIRKDGLRDCLFFDFDSKENPNDAIAEGMKFNQMLLDKDIPTYTQLSGSKGMHIFIWTELMDLKNYKAIMNKIADIYKLDYIDRSVFKNKLQLARVPTSINPKTMNRCEPLNDEIIFTDTLHDWLKGLDDDMEKENQRKTIRVKREYDKGLDATALISHYSLDVKSDLGERYIIHCPFHNDSNPSAALWKNGVFHCSTCNLSLTAYQFVAMKEDLNPADTKDVGQKIQEVLNG